MEINKCVDLNGEMERQVLTIELLAELLTDIRDELRKLNAATSKKTVQRSAVQEPRS